ncbi:hypothetical protein MNV49_003269 [Pseudohyphozyma bogoriensis]|nr:hypothetical protein MNV49_003269 [Pseudohyphozyma bogoriensis]
MEYHDFSKRLLTNRTCPAENDQDIDQADFWSTNGGHLDSHQIGWIVAGATASASTLISLYTILIHARNYYIPKEQRQTLRILFMPPVYAVVSFFSYRYFRSYTCMLLFIDGYYSVALVAYESIVLAAFLMLLLQYIGDSNDAQKRVLMDKEKRKIPIPFCCIRFRPSKPYFLHALKWSVLQYSLLRPLISIAGIITEAYGVLCPTQYSVYYAEVYLDSIDFVSISVALYGLIVFYALVKEQLAGKKPLTKFLSIKGIVMITFYQSFIFSVLEDYGVIKATEFWTATNVADGLQALCTCCEMVIFSIVFHFAFTANPYKLQRPVGAPKTNPLKALFDCFNYWDFIVEGWRGIVFTVRFILRKPGTRSSERGALDIDDAFLNNKPTGSPRSDNSGMAMRYVGQGGQDYQPPAQVEGYNGYNAQPATGAAWTGGSWNKNGRHSEDSYYQGGGQAQGGQGETAEEYEERTAREDAWQREQSGGGGYAGQFGGGRDDQRKYYGEGR